MNNDKIKEEIKEEVFNGCRVVYKTNKKHTLELFKDFLSKRSAKLFLKDSSKKEKEAI